MTGVDELEKAIKEGRLGDVKRIVGSDPQMDISVPDQYWVWLAISFNQVDILRYLAAEANKRGQPIDFSRFTNVRERASDKTKVCLDLLGMGLSAEELNTI